MKGDQEGTKIDVPPSMYNGRLDEKGRLKLSVDLQKYFHSFPSKRLFVTSLEQNTARIYPMEIWRQNEKFLREHQGAPQETKNVAFMAALTGSETEIDAQGRVLFSTDLRSRANLENQQLKLYSNKGHIAVLNEIEFQNRFAMASLTPRQDVESLERNGLQ
ncbi:MAG: hypothetical protein FJW37_01740 [Acidobacteria bacterium]|nr:hypothetical protein [Acidobacteriota bacterium]